MYMYLFVFKDIKDAQKIYIENSFNDYDWDRGFAVEEVVANEMISDIYFIQFVSRKPFDLSKVSDPSNLAFSLLNKEQFLCQLFFSDINFNAIPSYFGYLGEATEERNPEQEKIYKIEYSKYSQLKEVNLGLEDLLNSVD
jgi:hypothetical protein